MCSKLLLLLCAVNIIVVTTTNGQQSICTSGRQRIPGSKQTIELSECCPGYSRNSSSDVLKCDPVCSPPCGSHATCTAPGQCTCDVGFFKAWGRCVPHCATACVNGRCIAPNTCECLAGYRKTTNNTCDAVCSGGCEHGTCVAPNVCQCNWGYLNSPDSTCIPRCFQRCVNGVCVAPNVCRCSAGYEEIDKLCKPICPNGCDHGKCLLPNVCSCDPGYVKAANGTCIKGFYVTVNTNKNVVPSETHQDEAPSETHQDETTSPSYRDECPCWYNSMYIWIPVFLLTLIGISICAYCNWFNCFSNRNLFKRIR